MPQQTSTKSLVRDAVAASHRCCVCGTTRQTLYYCRPTGEPRGAWTCAAHADHITMSWLLASSILPRVGDPSCQRRFWPISVPPARPSREVAFPVLRPMWSSPKTSPPVCATAPDVQTTLSSAERNRL